LSAAVVSVVGREAVTEVWVSDIIGRVLIGVVTLQMLGLRVDPRTGKLEPSPLCSTSPPVSAYVL